MKKLLAILLLVTLLLSTAACSPAQKPAATETTEAATEAATEPAEPTSEVTTEPGETATEPEVLYSHCIPKAGVYSSEFAGFNFTAPEGWSFYTDEKLAEMSGMIKDVFDNEALREHIDNSGAIYEMLAIDTATGNNVNLGVQEIGVMEGLAYSEEKYADEVIPMLEETLTSGSYEVEFCRKGSITFLGEEKPCVEIQAVQSGVNITEVQMYKRVGNYVYFITITVVGQEAEAGLAAVAEICNSFSPYEAQP